MSLVSEGADYRRSLSAGTGLAEPSLATVGDYFTLMKPRVMSLVVFTALVGLAVAPGSLHPVTAFTALLCIAVGAGAAGALNMFNHHAFRDRVRLSGVNSINWARIIAQAVYYFTAAVALGAPHRKIAFTVPTGNFGDVYAGYVAARMKGLSSIPRQQ